MRRHRLEASVVRRKSKADQYDNIDFTELRAVKDQRRRTTASSWISIRAGITGHTSGCLFGSRRCLAPHEQTMLLFDKFFLRLPDNRSIQNRRAVRTSASLQHESLYVSLGVHLKGLQCLGQIRFLDIGHGTERLPPVAQFSAAGPAGASIVLIASQDSKRFARHCGTGRRPGILPQTVCMVDMACRGTTANQIGMGPGRIASAGVSEPSAARTPDTDHVTFVDVNSGAVARQVCPFGSSRELPQMWNRLCRSADRACAAGHESRAARHAAEFATPREAGRRAKDRPG